MVVGACVGRVFGMVINALHKSAPTLWIFYSCKAQVNCVTPGTYAMFGAAASLGGVTRMTVSLVVIMFELTGALSYVLPFMVTVFTAKWVGQAYFEHGIYDGLIKLNGYPFLPVEVTEFY